MTGRALSWAALTGAILTVASGAALAQDQNCAGRLSPACLQRLGAGSVSFDDPECSGQLRAYSECLSTATAAGPSDPQREERAERAYMAVKDSGDAVKLELVAKRFPKTFWGDLAAQDAATLRAGRVAGKKETPAPKPQPTPDPAALPATPPGLDPNIAAALQAPVSDRASLTQIQSHLQRLGYYDSGVDGIWGPGSRAALIRFQTASGLPATGEPTLLALQELKAASAAIGSVARAAPAARAQSFEGPIVTENGLAIGGYDPVAYFNQGAAVRGRSAHSYAWSGVTWRFSTAANQAAFEANPLVYAPQFGGHCAYCLSKGSLTNGDPHNWTLTSGRLYLHSSKANADHWRSGYPQMLPKAEAEWRSKTGARSATAAVSPAAAPAAPDAASQIGVYGPFVESGGLAIGGYDPVAFFEDGEATMGSSSITWRWAGVTWAFDSEENRDDFIADPAAYAPQYGGHCAYCLSIGHLYDGKGAHWDISEGKLYLHSSQANADAWRYEFASRRPQADANWARMR